jgi:hypothetical protein
MTEKYTHSDVNSFRYTLSEVSFRPAVTLFKPVLFFDFTTFSDLATE